MVQFFGFLVLTIYRNQLTVFHGRYFRAQLTDYVLDFGYVVSNTIPEHTFHAANCGYFPVSFMADKQALHNSGFTIHMDRVKNLPGFPDPESVAITVVFDPKNANIPEGPVRSRVPIKVSSLCFA